MKIAVRADASAALGLGHVKRCLSLAHALQARGAEVSLFWRRIDVDCGALITSHGVASVCFASGPTHDEVADADAFLTACHAQAPELIVVDHYGLGSAWHRAVRRSIGARLAAIDDLGDRALDIDTLIDPNLASDHALKFAGRLPATAKLLCGPDFALLGPAYASARRCEVRSTVRSIGIFMGGTDDADLSTLALEALCEDIGFAGHIEVATTGGNPHRAELARRVQARGDTVLTLDQPDLAAFFARHDLHIGAGGGATWERCCIGAPTLAVIAAANQRQVLLPLQRLGVLSVLTEEPPTAADIAVSLRELIANAALRRNLARRSRELVDGRGAQRVAQHLLAP
jgi:UDP-2,4-diacetamido-2,4,6-trideoxy-beta-L-altropyranose hydrolase